MSQATAYSVLYPQMWSELPGLVDQGLLLQQLQAVGRQFCVDTEAWREEIGSIAVVDWGAEYTLAHPYTASAEIHRIHRVKVNEIEQDDSDFELVRASVLRFSRGRTPHDLDNMLLKCAAAGSDVVTTWQALTGALEGSFTLELDDSTYSVEDLDFASIADMHGAASVIQAGARAEMENEELYCRWVTDRFHLWTDSGVMTDYLTAGASGTDISGASWMNGLTGAGTLAPHLWVECVFRPHLTTDTLPDWFFDRWATVIMGGAIANLAEQAGKPWNNAATAAKWRRVYNQGWSAARHEDLKQYRARPVTIGA